MKAMSARETKNSFGWMIDTTRVEPVRIEKHGRGVVVVISVEKYERHYAQNDHGEQKMEGDKGERDART